MSNNIREIIIIAPNTFAVFMLCNNPPLIIIAPRAIKNISIRDIILIFNIESNIIIVLKMNKKSLLRTMSAQTQIGVNTYFLNVYIKTLYESDVALNK